MPLRALLPAPVLWMRRITLGGAAALASLLAAAVMAAPPDSVDRDYSQELPRIAPLSPDQALQAFHTADGFEMQQAAAEPTVVDPIAMAFDEKGRMFVVEMRGYSEDEEQNLGRVRLLVDADNDGRFESSTVYAEGLSWPTAIVCYEGGVFVGAAPDVWYFRDNDGDGKAEEQTKVFTGFGRSNVQGLLNTFTWGLDNRIHGAVSSSGATLVKVGSSDPPLTLRGRDFSFDPRTLELRAESGGGQHGLSFDRFGRKFVCSNSDHLQMVMYEDRYGARNPYAAAPNSRQSIAADGPQADVFRNSPVEPWRIVRTRLRKQGIVPGPVEGGGTAAGYFTGATGVTLYRGDAWPAEADSWAIIGDVGSNLIHRKRLEPAGVGMIGRRIDQQSEFVTSTDIWFRPVQYGNGPDGCLYIADMYREVIEHPKSLHPVIKTHLDLTSGRDRGRIYRLAPVGFSEPERYDFEAPGALVKAIDSRNGWRRETAARLIYQSQDVRLFEPLRKLATQAALPESRIQALYALTALVTLYPELLAPALADKDPRVREHAVRLSESQAPRQAELRQLLYGMTADADLRVLHQLAFSLGALESSPARNECLADLLRAHSANPWIVFAVHSSLVEGSGSVLKTLSADVKYRQSTAGRKVLTRLAAQIARQQHPADVVALLDVVGLLAGDQPTLQALLEAMQLAPTSDLAKRIDSAASGKASEYRLEAFTAARQAVLDSKLSEAERQAAIARLTWGEWKDCSAPLAQLLQPSQPDGLQLAALDVIAEFDTPEAGRLVLDRWKSLTPRVKRQAGEVLFSRRDTTLQLLTRAADGAIAPADLDVGMLKRLALQDDPQVMQAAKAVLAKRQTSSPVELLAAYQKSLETEGDAERGRAVFTKTCAACHQMGEIGHAIGPSLPATLNRGAEAFLAAVLDPNREVNPQFLNYAFETRQGRIFSGAIASETAASIIVQQPENKKLTILRIDIEAMVNTGQSLMPEGLEKQVSVDAMADLLAFLRSDPLAAKKD
ncbi:PVC-type heme-binding CxxCH protein [Lignipirellula cremea]|uniref:Cytochrome c n=1 Tax=Lignipirellula cremea TaxID=2528010 RepID=A0A518DVA2_9BACT|nr:PVC-type heme-binding CxxCH protein [Lignipirellula cremea]QDU95765.1 Cytochrome c [Lignipirellula cremea]